MGAQAFAYVGPVFFLLITQPSSNIPSWVFPGFSPPLGHNPVPSLPKLFTTVSQLSSPLDDTSLAEGRGSYWVAA